MGLEDVAAVGGVDGRVHVPRAGAEEDGLVEVGAVGGSGVIVRLTRGAAAGTDAVGALVDGGGVASAVDFEVEVAGRADVLVAGLGGAGADESTDDDVVILGRVGGVDGRSNLSDDGDEEKRMAKIKATRQIIVFFFFFSLRVFFRLRKMIKLKNC